jgi:hypothetical protein
VGFFVDAVNAHLTPMIVAIQFLRDRCRWGKARKETFATIMMIAGRVEVK